MTTKRFSYIRIFWLLILSAFHRRDEKKMQAALAQIDPTGTRIVSRQSEPYDERPMNFLRGARKPAFRAALAEMSELCAMPPMAHEDIWGAAFFEAEEKLAVHILAQKHVPYLKQGVYLFRAERNFTYDKRTDLLGLIPTRSRSAVVYAMQTNGENDYVNTYDIIAWLKRLQRRQPILLTGIGQSFIEGEFTGAVNDPFALARSLMDLTVMPSISLSGAV